MVPCLSLRAAAIALVVVACTSPSRDDVSQTVRELASPASSPSGEPNLTTDADGGVYLSWLEKTGDSTYALKFSRLEGDTWTAPRVIAERNDFFVNWADFPSLVVSSGGQMVAHWLQKSGDAKYAYDTRLSRSSDGGTTWTSGVLLNRDGVEAEHGFVALWPADDGGVEAVWLDGRAFKSPDTSARAMQVLNARYAADGSLGADIVLDVRACDCCQTAVARTVSGPVVAYRDRSADEIRDIAIVRRVDGAWTAPRTVHDDGWRIEACPVNGPALSARGDTVVATWFTGARDTAKVQAAFSDDAGATFGPAIRIDGGNPAGRVAVELLDDGTAVVSWLERTASGSAEVRLRRVFANRAPSDPIVIATSSEARASGFPRLARSGDVLIAAWTQPGDSARVRVARVPVASLP